VALYVSAVMPDTSQLVPPTLSNLPGRSSAGSIMSGRLVAAMTYTPYRAAQHSQTVLCVCVDTGVTLIRVRKGARSR
jgi:hypothetical protein